MTIEWQPKDQPIYQTTDTFQQLVDKLNDASSQIDSDNAYLDSAFGPLSGSSFELSGLTTTGKSLVDAINELDSDIGVISTLDTNDKTNLVAAINEIEAIFDASEGKINSVSDFTVDAANDILLDAFTGNIVLQKNGTNYARLQSNGGNLKIQSGFSNTTAMQFTGANVELYGSVALPSTGIGSITSSEISANTVHGAIDEVNARIPNVYDASGTLLNP